MTGLCPRILDQLQEQGSSERAAWDAKYHKSDLKHFGCAATEANAITRDAAKGLALDEALHLARELWQSEIWDARIVAAKLLAMPRFKGEEALWSYLLEYLPQMDGWAVMDGHMRAANKCLLMDPTRLDEVENWTQNPSFWIRRAALVFTLPWAKPGKDPERMLGWASRYADDREWFIQKAIGWWLRTLSKHDPNRVIEFLEQHDGQLMAVARREAVKYLK